MLGCWQKDRPGCSAATAVSPAAGAGDNHCVTHERRPVSADGAPEALGPYSHAVVADGLLFCSGQVPIDPDTNELIDGDAGAQTRRCLDNLTAVCQAAGAALGDAVRLTIYAVDLAGDWAEINEAYGTYFSDGPPARAAIGVAALPKGARVEIDAIVALSD
jgi:2-iminobutanoate/2-iminopropanoate deaminase